MRRDWVDLRSDTVTRPGPAMRRAMAEAEVGDDVYGEDPTVRRLEEEAAARVGHESALFVPTGTMGNQIALHLHADRGEDVLLEAFSHVYLYELGALSAWTGATPRLVSGDRGRLDPAGIVAAAAGGPYYMARAAAVVVENTHNHQGGTVTSAERTRAIVEAARSRGLRVHLDGARLFNAATALGVSPAALAAGFDTVMFCLSKGLGAPAGSLLCGERRTIEEARIVRKRMGGGMRQAGILAAAGLVALREHVTRLPEDHVRARRLAGVLAEHPRFRIDPAAVETNIVIAEVVPPARAEDLLTALKARGVLALAMGPGRIRFVTHLDIGDAELDRALDALRQSF